MVRRWPDCGRRSSAADADAALSRLSADSRSGTALWDAILRAATALKGEDQPGHVIIVVTDGRDVSSTATFADAVAAAHHARAAVYAIGIAGPDFTPGPLRELAAQTGGTYLEASSSAELVGLYASISQTLDRTWQLSYPTAARPGDTLRLAVSIPGGDSAVRTVALPSVGVSTAAPAPPSRLLPRSAWRSRFAAVVVAGAVGLLLLLACAFVAAARSGMWLSARLAPHLAPAERRRRKRSRHRDHNVLRG